MVDTVGSRIERVVVHPGAAMVRRTAEVVIAGPGEIAVRGLPYGLVDDSVQVTVTGPGRAVSARVAIETVALAAASTVDDEVAAASSAVAAVTAERAAVRASLQALGGLAAVPAGDREARPRWSDAVTARQALVELGRTRSATARAALAELDRAVIAAERALAAAEERRAQRSSAERAAGALTKAVIARVIADGAGGACTVAVCYRVDGARWVPSYVARLADGEVRLELRAAVSQATGEDWTGVALELSTAAPARRVELPELPALRIGRAQPTPARAGWRTPPEGVDELYRDWDRAFAGGEPPKPAVLPPPPPAPEPEPDFDGAKLDDEFVGGARELAAFAPSMTVAAPPASAAPMKKMAMKTRSFSLGRSADEAPARSRASVARGGGEGGGGAGPGAAPAIDAAPVAARDELLEFGALVMPAPDDAGRGRLRRVRPEERAGLEAAVSSAASQQFRDRWLGVLERAVPGGCVAPAPGHYDYAYTTTGTVDVAGDGAWHAIAVSAHTAAITVVHVATPAVAPEVYRVATLGNPLDAPLLAGPVDVYEHDELVLTAPLAETPPGGTVTIGLGVDPTVKVARNVRFREETAGVLRGSLRLLHDVTIDVEHVGRRAVTLEVRERVPLPAPDVDDVEVALDEVVPPWEPWRPEPTLGTAALKGGHRWQLALEPGQRRTLRWQYAIKISSKHELVGGNRRES